MNEQEVRTEEFQVNGDTLVARIKELVHEGNIRRVVIKDEEGKTLIDLPLTIGVAGALVRPKLLARGRYRGDGPARQDHCREGRRLVQLGESPHEVCHCEEGGSPTKQSQPCSRRLLRGCGR
jgi:CBS domain-containing protein